jgi:hypothetical protein
MKQNTELKLGNLIRRLIKEESSNTSWSDSKGRTIKNNDLVSYKNEKFQVYGETETGGLKLTQYGKFRQGESLIIPASYKPKFFGYLTIIG